jgi:hypothetical protein
MTMLRTFAVLPVLLGLALTGTHGQAQEKADGWNPWLADLDAPGPDNRPAPALTADYFPHKPGTTRTETTTRFDKDGKADSVIVKQRQHRDKGVIASRIVKVADSGGGGLSSPDLFPESITLYEVKDGFVRIGYPKDPEKAGSPTEWFEVLKLGAKPGDRWSAYAYKAAGTYKGTPCVVVTSEHAYAIFVKGVGKVLDRSYAKKGEMLVISSEEKYE